MGNFADRIRKIFNPKKQQEIEFKRQAGLRDDARIVPLSQMHKPHDAYFIRHSDLPKGMPDCFVKMIEGQYILQSKPENACIWTLESAKEFIKSIDNIQNLEPIRVDQIINS